MRSAALLLALLALAPAAHAGAGFLRFLPRPAANDLVLELFGSRERDDFGGTTEPARWTDAFLREKLTFASEGYAYHPRFLRYRLTAGALLSQENYESLFVTEPAWAAQTGLEYDVAVTLLPEHRYNLTAFASRHEPLFKEHVQTAHDRVGTTVGARVRYEQRPWFGRAGFSRDTIAQGTQSSRVQKANAEAKYYRELGEGDEISAVAAFNPVWTRTSGGLRGFSREAYAANTVRRGGAQLNSSLTDLSGHQDHSATGDWENDQLVWHEHGTVHLPLRFRTDGSYRYHDNRSRFARPDGLARTLRDRGHDVQIDVVHRLYQSLDSRYGWARASRTSDPGQTASTTHTVAVNYAKRIPLQGTLLLGGSGSRWHLDSEGPATSIVGELHPGIAVPGAFTLGQPHVVPGSVIVVLKSPLPPFELVTLAEGAHYTLVPVVSALEIRVFALPLPFVVPGSYELQVSYSVVGGDFSLRSRSSAASASVKLWGDLLTVGGATAATHSDVIAGSFPGIPIDSRSTSASVRVSRGSWRATGEYGKLDWEISPRETWKAQLHYTHASGGGATRLQGSVAWESTRYLRDESLLVPGAFTEEALTATASVQRRLRSPRMSFSAGGAFTRLERRLDGTVLSWNGSWTWRIGRLEIDAGASGYRYRNTGISSVAYARDHELYFLKLRRELF